MGLLEDDSEIDKAMEEAVSIRFGDNLRDMFVTLLENCIPNNGLQFWEKWRTNLCEDKVRHERATEITDLIESKVLVYIIDLLERSGFSLEIFNLPAPKVEHLVVVEHRILREETEFDFHALNEKVFQGYPGLNGVKSSI